jgi:hypothetical protein
LAVFAGGRFAGERVDRRKVSRKIRVFGRVVSVVSSGTNFLAVEFMESIGCGLRQVVLRKGDAARKFFFGKTLSNFAGERMLVSGQ